MLLQVLEPLPGEKADLIWVSIGAALLNTVMQMNKMILEAKELDEDVLDYL